MKLPNFMIIGVAKAGTTSLFRYLDQHPHVHMCPIKGSNYFGYQDACHWIWDDEGEAPKLRHFPVHTYKEYLGLFAGATDETAIGESSPQYLRCPTAAQRIRRHLPGARLIVSLRNPADRAFSGFLMRARRGEKVASPAHELTPESSHVRESFYYSRLKRYYDLFPRDQIQVLLFEDFKRNPASQVTKVFEFLQVDADFRADTSRRHNPAGIPKNRLLNRLYFHPTVIRSVKAMLPASAQRLARSVRQRNLQTPPAFPPDLRARLLLHFRDDILQLQSLIDRDLTSWLDGSPVQASAAS